MKNLKSLLAAVVASVAVAGVAHAAPSVTAPVPSYVAAAGSSTGARVFDFIPNSQVTHGGSGSLASASTSLTGAEVDTIVTVKPYLYAIGKLGGDWEIDGWGDGSSTVTGQYLDVYHSNPFVVNASGWGNPVRTGGVGNGGTTRNIPMTVSVTSKNASGVPIGTLATAEVNVSNLNFASAVGAITPETTLGHLDSEFTFKLSPNETTYSGTYSMTPTMTFTSQ